MTKLDFGRWIMRNFCELKEHVLNQCKETKNLEKRFEKEFEEMITRMDNLERNMNELKELKNTRTLQSMHKFQQPNWPSRRKNIRSRRSTQ